MISKKPTPPTERQINYINRLGYKGVLPSTVKEASCLLDTLTDGGSPKKAQRSMLKYRAKKNASCFRGCFNLITFIAIVTVIAIMAIMYFL